MNKVKSDVVIEVIRGMIDSTDLDFVEIAILGSIADSLDEKYCAQRCPGAIFRKMYLSELPYMLLQSTVWANRCNTDRLRELYQQISNAVESRML